MRPDTSRLPLPPRLSLWLRARLIMWLPRRSAVRPPASLGDWARGLPVALTSISLSILGAVREVAANSQGSPS
jgi:hypothetical protein